jgi:hypothetical protein
MPDSYSNIGHVYKINPSARILHIRDTYDAKHIYSLYRDLGVDLNPNSEYSTDHYEMTKDFPWHEICKHWDAVHHNPGYGDRYGFTYTYDVESTVWFNTNVLDYIGKVRIRPCDYQKDD